MERLTKMIKCPDGTNIYDFSEKAAKKYITDHKGGVRALFEKLAQYEDTGLTPEQIEPVNTKSLNATDSSKLLTNIVFTLKDTVIKALEENDTEVLRDEIYYCMQEYQEEGEK